jgi:hypothetical protein
VRYVMEGADELPKRLKRLKFAIRPQGAELTNGVKMSVGSTKRLPPMTDEAEDIGRAMHDRYVRELSPERNSRYVFSLAKKRNVEAPRT